MSDINFSKIRRLDGGLLVIFQELMRHQRTTVVAERLNLSQSAISHALARLRELFEDQLFLRRPNGLEPTQRAKELAPQIEELILLSNHTLDTGKPFNPMDTGRVFRLGGGDFMSALIAAPLLNLFEKEAPKASFIFRFMLGQQAMESLHRDEIDLAVGRFNTLGENVVIDELYQENYCVVARAEHPRLNGEIDLATFSELGHVIIALGKDMEQLGDDNLKRLSIERKVVAAVPRFFTGFTLVSQSDAILIAQRHLANRYAKAFHLQVLDVPYPTPTIPIVAARKKADKHEVAINWLVDKVRQSIGTAL